MTFQFTLSKDADTLVCSRKGEVQRGFLRNSDKGRTLMETETGEPIPEKMWSLVLKALRGRTPRHPSDEKAYDKVVTLTFKRKWHYDLSLVEYDLDFDMFAAVLPIVTALNEAGAEKVAGDLIDLTREYNAATRKVALSELQLEYQAYFREKMEAHGLTSISGGTPEQLAAFFDDIRDGWVKGKGRKSSSAKVADLDYVDIRYYKDDGTREPDEEVLKHQKFRDWKACGEFCDRLESRGYRVISVGA